MKLINFLLNLFFLLWFIINGILLYFRKIDQDHPYFSISILLIIFLSFLSNTLYFFYRYLKQPAGIDNHHIYTSSFTGRGFIAYILSIILTLLYIVIYFGDRIFILNTNLNEFLLKYFYIQLSPISLFLSNSMADNWFFYSFLYTYFVLLFGIRMILKYRHNNYQIVRTISVMFFQLFFAFLIPKILVLFKQPEFYFSYFWPLKPEYLYPSTWFSYLKISPIAFYFLIFSAITSFFLVPILTYLYGKRWYCSWVCGCGGLANTAGDFFRQHSSKSLMSWKLERILIYSVLGLISMITILLWINSFLSGKIFGNFSQTLAEWYGFYIGAIWSGVIGVGFYPIFGTRVWCRFGCPQAAILGIIQKYFSRFRITTNGGQCISCGNCSVYCEMGIDVRWYAQKGLNIVRASCVGCGICSAVCPRGVLKLENGTWKITDSLYPSRIKTKIIDI